MQVSLCKIVGRVPLRGGKLQENYFHAFVLMGNHYHLIAEIGRYFGNISFSAVTRIVTILKAKMKEDKGLKAGMDEIEEKVSCVKG
jgi:hypothetical protein